MNVLNCVICSLVCGILFFALTPGVLLTLPPKCNKKVFLALKDNKHGCATSYEAAGVHAVVFALVMFIICLFKK
jgi:hypothetical protein